MTAYFPLLTKDVTSLPFYVCTVGITPNEVSINRPDGIEDYQILYCIKGAGNVVIDGETKKITPETGFILPPWTRHFYYATQQPWETSWVTFNGSAAEQVLVQRKGAFKVTQPKLLQVLFNGIYKLPRDDFWAEKSSVNLYKLLIGLKRCIATDTHTSVYDIQQKISPAAEYMKANFSSQLELADLSDIINISTEHFCRLFKSAYGLRPFEYLTGLRLQKSKELLVSRRDLSIAQVGEAVGYGSPSYFIKLFKKYEKQTPEEFRSLH